MPKYKICIPNFIYHDGSISFPVVNSVSIPFSPFDDIILNVDDLSSDDITISFMLSSGKASIGYLEYTKDGETFIQESGPSYYSFYELGISLNNIVSMRFYDNTEYDNGVYRGDDHAYDEDVVASQLSLMCTITYDSNTNCWVCDKVYGYDGTSSTYSVNMPDLIQHQETKSSSDSWSLNIGSEVLHYSGFVQNTADNGEPGFFFTIDSGCRIQAYVKTKDNIWFSSAYGEFCFWETYQDMLDNVDEIYVYNRDYVADYKDTRQYAWDYISEHGWTDVNTNAGWALAYQEYANPLIILKLTNDSFTVKYVNPILVGYSVFIPDLKKDSTTLNFTVDEVNQVMRVTISNPSPYTLHNIEMGRLYLGIDFEDAGDAHGRTMENRNKPYKDRLVRHTYHPRWTVRRDMGEVIKVTDVSLTYTLDISNIDPTHLHSIWWILSYSTQFHSPDRHECFTYIRPILIKDTSKMPIDAEYDVQTLFDRYPRMYAPASNKYKITVSWEPEA